MREALKQSLLADDFGDGEDPHCLLILREQFDEYWQWARDNNIDCRPVKGFMPTIPDYVSQRDFFEAKDIHNSMIVYIPDSVKYIFAKMKWE